jgi:hypothetical protein
MASADLLNWMGISSAWPSARRVEVRDQPELDVRSF